MSDVNVNKEADESAEEVEVEVVPFEYPAEQDIDEQRRAYIISHMACADIDGSILVSNMERVFHWLKGDQEVLCSTTPRQPAPSSCVSLVPTGPSSKA